MTVTPQRAQLVDFTRPYYIEGVALLTKPGSPREKCDALLAGRRRHQDLDPAERRRRELGAQGPAAGAGDAARHPGQRHPGARGRRVPTPPPSTSRRCGGWPSASRTSTPMPASQLELDALRARRCARAISTGCSFVNTTFNVAMFGHQNEIFDKAVRGVLRPAAAAARVRPAEVLRPGRTPTRARSARQGVDATSGQAA